MQLSYSNIKVEKCFSNLSYMKRFIPLEWVKSVKKHIDWLESADCFGDYLSLGLGKPEQLRGYKNIQYAVHISANVRLILEPVATHDTLMSCTEIRIIGVVDYHGNKENWFIP